MNYDDWKTRAPEDERFYGRPTLLRTCCKCGASVVVRADEPYTLQIWCGWCLDNWKPRAEQS